MEPVRFDLKLSRQAELHLDRIHRYVARNSVESADRLLMAIAVELSRLSQFPHAGRPGRVDGTRELIISGTSYVAIYRVRAHQIAVAGIFHGAQKRSDF